MGGEEFIPTISNICTRKETLCMEKEFLELLISISRTDYTTKRQAGRFWGRSNRPRSVVPNIRWISRWRRPPDGEEHPEWPAYGSSHHRILAEIQSFPRRCAQ